MGAGALTICHNRAAVQIREDVKKMVQLPMLKQRPPGAGRRLFSVPLPELGELGLGAAGVPLVLSSMVEFLREHALEQEGLFRVNGNVRMVERLRQRLESGEEVDLLQEADVCTVASLLKQFLRELPGGVVTCSVQEELLQLYQECGEEQFGHALRLRLRQLPGVHYGLLRYLCHFLSQVAERHEQNRMTALNLATVFGPNVFHVPPGFDGMKDQTVCNKVMALLIRDQQNIFEGDAVNPGAPAGGLPAVLEVKGVQSSVSDSDSPRGLAGESSTSPLRKKVKKMSSDGSSRTVPQPDLSSGLPQIRPLPPVRTRDMELSSSDVIGRSTDSFSSYHEDERPMSPFYVSSLLSSAHCQAQSADRILERTIHSVVEHHLFNVCANGERGSEDPQRHATARQRRRCLQERDEGQRSMSTDDIDKENVPEEGGNHKGEPGGRDGRGVRKREVKKSPLLAEVMDNREPLPETGGLNVSPVQDQTGEISMEPQCGRRDNCKRSSEIPSQTSTMKIQETQSDLGRVDGCEEVPRLDLSTLMEESHWGDPVPAYSSWQRESMDREEARLSPHTGGGRLIRQLLAEGSDPMLSPRFQTYGHCPQYLEDTEVPPSPPNAHSFMSRRRSSSLGSCEDDRGELTSAQISKKIHTLKKKIRKYEEKFEEERKYRPSHSDKAANPEVLRWMNELSKLRKDLKEHQLLKSEEDLPPLTRQRSNTLPKSFGSQLERKTPEKAPQPPVESTLEAVQKKLLEKRQEAGRPEDIKDMTREQIGAEKVALQKALLYYESIHGRPVTNGERQVMKPLYDRYRLVKQILSRASAIPVIEEEDGSEEDGEAKTQLSVTAIPEFSMLGFLEHLEEEADGFVSPVDELSPSKGSADMRLSNLHSATMQELMEQLQEAREEKKRLRKNLRDFEDQFFRQNGRSVQKEDRSPLAEEYSEYKHVKAKLKLLEVLISKRDSGKVI
ncbi:protein FAM13A isoform X2 [Paramormyrops kingsleyae]|uniref:protein FAM13A isoform X2 n=1 Tax=Paramormyrops kingsleyae TaxID=1676925 RepID=UPI003B979E0E